MNLKNPNQSTPIGEFLYNLLEILSEIDLEDEKEKKEEEE